MTSQILDTSNITKNYNVEIFKQKVHVSCQNIITVAESAIRNHPELEKVVIVEHAPRFDLEEVDPTGLKPRLAVFANNTLNKLQHSSEMKDKIVIGKHSLDKMHSRMYKDERTGRYDGLHMYGMNGFFMYTESVLKIIQTNQDEATCVIPPSPPQFSSVIPSSPPQFSYHDNCPQAQYQRRQISKQQSSNTMVYNVPTNNKFEVLNQ